MKIKSIFKVRTVFLILALIPVLALVAITLNLILGSTHAISTLGFRLFSSAFSPSTESGLAPDQMHYGLLPAIWGTFLVVFISIGVAFPTSLALAALANDFSTGLTRSAIRWVIGVVSGIPPIIYAMMGVTFFFWFFVAKFGGRDLPADKLPPPSMLPGDASCTLLGGLMLALLIIPFLTPLLDDALHGVPGSLKEASLSLGANRWHTLKSVTIPVALPAIVNALLLGVLTAMGESIIVAYAIGLGAKSLPSPLFDLLQRTAPLTATIAGVGGGGFSRAVLIGPVGQSVSNFMGLLLLAAAFAILGVTVYLQGRIKKRLA